MVFMILSNTLFLARAIGFHYKQIKDSEKNGQNLFSLGWKNGQNMLFSG